MTAAIPPLKHKAEFKRLLAGYRIAEAGRRILDQTELVVLSGVAGGGRNTVIRRLVDQDNYYFIVSDTTRPPKVRDGRLEENGVHYFFRSEADVLDDLKNGRFLEAELIHDQQVSGISLRELERATAAGRIAITDVEIGGIQNIAAASRHAHIVGLLPPDFNEWLRRFRDREVIPETEYLNRLRTARIVLAKMLEEPYFKLVINDRVDDCVEHIRQIVAGRYQAAENDRAKQAAAALLIDVQKALK